MQEITLTLINKLGLHARSAAKLVNVASKYKAEITLHKKEQWANAKSIMGIMMLGAARGTALVIRAEGSDAEAALTALTALFADRFGEAE